jgi:hypothetical protein
LAFCRIASDPDIFLGFDGIMGDVEVSLEEFLSSMGKEGSVVFSDGGMLR